MKIVHVISTLNIGGAENFVMQLANQQSYENSVVIVITGITDGNKNYIDKIDKKVTIYQLNWKQKYSLQQFFQLNSLLGKIEPTCVYVHLHNPLYYIYGVSLIKRKIKYVHTIHSSFDNWKGILKYLNKLRFLNNRILHVCVAKSIHEKLTHHFPKLRSTLINNGIRSYNPYRDLTQVKSFWNSFSIKPQIGKRFLAIGNINRHKNYKILAQSFAKIYDSHPDAMCLHIGNEMDTVLSDELKEINAPNLFLAGVKDNAADFLSEADALVVSSVQEGMPIVVLEALSMGVPIIATPAGGLVDVIVDGFNGFLIQDFKELSLRLAIKKFIALTLEEKQEMGINAKAYFEENYDINKVSKIYKNKSA